MAYLSKQEIQKIIPHREPFVLIDEITAVEFGKSAVGCVNNVAHYDFFNQMKKHNKTSDFILVDSIKVNAAAKQATGLINDIKNLQPFFQGHFPGQPIFPGALTLEALAEVARYLLLKTTPFPQEVFLQQVNGWRFKQPIVPGDKVELQVEQKDENLIECQALVNEKIAASGKLLFVPQPLSQSQEITNNNQRVFLSSQVTLLPALIIEAMAEVGAVAVLGMKEQRGKIAFLASLDKWHFYQPISVGKPITLKATLVDLRLSFGKGHFTAQADSGLIAEGYIMFGLGKSRQP